MSFTPMANITSNCDNFHICTVHPAMIKVIFYYQLMHKRIVLKEY